MSQAGGGLAARRAVVRWAWRLFRREWRQQTLLLVLLTVTVAAAVFGATAAYNLTPSRDGEFGRAERRIELRAPGPATVEADLAAIAAVYGTIDVIGHRPVPVPGSVETVDLRSQDPQGPFGAPMLALREGRYPTAPGEVALTGAVAELLGAAVGDTLDLDGPRTVVGLVENPADLADEFALVAPSTGAAPAAISVLVGAGAGKEGEATGGGLGQLPSGTEYFAERRGDTEKTTAAALVLVLATVVMLLVCLVAAAGFAVVAQRRLRQLGLMAAIGATSRHLRLVVLANGVVVGVVAAVAGTATALVGWIAVAPRLESAAGHRLGRFDVPWWLVAGGSLLAVATATAAAWWPARSVVRIPITMALSSRPPRPKRARRSAVAAGLLLLAGFVALALGVDTVHDEVNAPLLIGGTVSVVAGIVFASPLAIRILAVTAAPLPLAARLAVRDLARHQARSGAALAAISLGLGIAVATVVIATAAAPAADEGNLSERQVLFRVGDGGPVVPERTAVQLEQLQAAVDGFAGGLDGASVVPLDAVVNPDDRETQDGQVVRPAVVLGRTVNENTTRDLGMLYVATPATLAHLGLDVDDVPAGADVLSPHTGDLRFANLSKPPAPLGSWPPVPNVAPIDIPLYSSADTSLMLPEGLRRGGWEAVRAGWLVEAATPLTGTQLAQARDVAAEAGMTVEARRGEDVLDTTRTVATLAGIVLALSILAMTVGLVRSESAGDLRTLTASGATSTARRTLTAATAGALALLGVALGIAAAYLALIAGYLDDLQPLADVPWSHLAATALGLPLIAAAAGWLVAGREPATLTRPALD